MNLKCFECGGGIEGDVYTVGELAFLNPVFCSNECADEYDPSEISMEKIYGLRAWLRPRLKLVSGIPFRVVCLDIPDDLKDVLIHRCGMEYRWEGPLWF